MDSGLAGYLGELAEGEGSGSGCGCGCGSGSGNGGGEHHASVGSINEMQLYPWPPISANSNIASWEISWGDGTSDTYFPNQSPDHTYLDDDPSGSPQDEYEITVTQTFTSGCTRVDYYPITIRNVSPDAVADTGETNEDEAIVISVLGNDTDDSAADQASLDVTSFDASATIGAVEYLGGGQFSYDPTGKFNLAEDETATDTFAYSIQDDDFSPEVTSQVTVTVHGVQEHYTVTISTIENAEEEDAKAGRFNLTISPPAGKGGISVPWAVVAAYSDLGVDDRYDSIPEDFANGSGSVFFDEGETDKEVTLTPVDDAIVEHDENAYIWFHSVETPAYTLDASTFAVVTLTDNEWRWVTEARKITAGTPDGSPIPIYDEDGGQFPDSWEAMVSVEWKDNQIISAATSKYTAISILNQTGSISTASLTGTLEFQLNPTTGVISLQTSSEGGLNHSGPAVAALEHTPIEIDNSGDTEHTVSTTVYVSAGQHGDYTFATDGTVFAATITIDYGADYFRREGHPLVARKGNGS
jgi:hypothetical protein